VDWFAIGIGVFLSVLVAFVTGIIAWVTGDHWGLCGVRRKKVYGVVTGKYYHAPSTTTAFGVAVNPSGGGVSPVVTTSTTYEDFILEIRLDGYDDKIRLSVCETIFDSLDKGDRVETFYRISRFSGHTHWSSDVMKAS